MFSKKEFFGLNEEEIKIFKKYNSPSKIQDFLDSLKINFEEEGKDTCMSPKMVLKSGKAHCMEGAIIAAAMLRFHGYPPLLLDLEATPEDFDHVVTLFKIEGFWGALGKTNHGVLRYREPVYRDIRELVMSFFHEYFLNKNGKKTLRAYAGPIDLKRFDNLNWIGSEEEVWFIPEYLANVKHIQILTKKQIKNLRLAHPIEIEAGKIVEHKYYNEKN
ncbi:hypothetical protein COU54_02375 [Candidatus Pacearchaeota archaeon CG10_big_fil_rev_8_21_14_0_10_31_24]|nr:MAG: hypothetical protein COU54_02375 [Candidatus Pacearchaeota archaeon CG10_big_fil_rev_8_21_14_0_10_31_24]